VTLKKLIFCHYDIFFHSSFFFLLSLKHKILKNPSGGGNKAVVMVNTNLECHSDSSLTCPKTQQLHLMAHHHQKQPLIRHPSLNGVTHNSIDQQQPTLSVSPEEGRINFSKKQQNHSTKHVVKMLGKFFLIKNTIEK
jgi:hypothetical protein